MSEEQLLTEIPPVVQEKKEKKERKNKDTATTSPKTLFVRGLPFDCSNADLEAFFSEIGPIKACFAVVDTTQTTNQEEPKQVKNKGYGFVHYALTEDAIRAMVELKKRKFMGKRTLKMELALKKTHDPAKKAALRSTIVETPKKVKKAEKAENVEEGEDDVEDEGDDNEDEECAEEEESVSETEGDEEGEQDAEEDEEEDDDEENEEEGEGEEAEPAAKPARVLPTADDGTTLYIRNLSFDSTEEELKEKFNDFGPVRYARIVKCPTSGRSRGVGFVCFRDAKTAKECIQSYEALSAQPGCGTGDGAQSVLVPELAADAAGKYALDGRLLSVTLAVSKSTAKEFEEKSAKKREKEDKRNVYLMTEGVIFPNTPAAADLTPNEISKRQASYTSRKALIAKNPLLFISKTRLSVRNLPIKVDEKDLRKLALDSVRLFKEEVKCKKREGLTDDEKREGWDEKPKVVQAKIVRDQERIDVDTGKPKSKGYGFLEFARHSHALASLRYMNNNPDVFKHVTFTQIMENAKKGESEGQNGKANEVQKGMPTKRRMIVEFSVENVSVVKKRQERLTTQRKRHGNEDEGKGILHKRKRGNEEEGKENPQKRRNGNDKGDKKPFNRGTDRKPQQNRVERKTGAPAKRPAMKKQDGGERAANAKRTKVTKPTAGKRKAEKTDSVEDIVKKHKKTLTGGDQGSGKSARWFE